MVGSDIFHLLLCLMSLLLLARGVAALAIRIGLPAVLAEITLGILIGPTLLGIINPELSAWLFPVSGDLGAMMKLVSKLAVILLLFVAGLEMNLNSLRTDGPKVVATAMGSFLIPFAMGITVTALNPGLFGSIPEHPWLVPAFVGVALSISALPVIIRILMDLGLYRAPMGMITVAAASLMDLMGWIAYAVVLGFLYPVTLQNIADMLWSHSTLLSLITGAVVSNLPFVTSHFKEQLQNFVIRFISPLFFVSIGVEINFVANFSLALVLVIILIACISKIMGSFIGGKLGGLSNKDALAVGFALNARGAMEIILSKEAYAAGLIQSHLFVALVVMAMFTSLMSGPMMRLLMERRKRTR